MPAGGLVVAGAIGLGTLIYGEEKKKKAQKQQAALAASRPKYDINPEEYDIENLAESRANQGMGAGARQQLQNNADRQLSTLSNSALMGGADANAIGGLVDKSANAYSQNAIYDDQVRISNLNNLQQSWARMSANKDKSWAINSNQPWKDQMAGVAGQIAQADTIVNQGVSGIAGAAGGIGKSLYANRGMGGGGGAAPLFNDAAQRGISPNYYGGGGAGADQLGDLGGGGNNGDNSWMPKGPQSYPSNSGTYSYWGA